MNKFFLSIMHSWGSDAPQEVYWSLNDPLDWARTKGFKGAGSFNDPTESYDTEEEYHNTNERLIRELSDWFESLN